MACNLLCINDEKSEVVVAISCVYRITEDNC